MTAQRVALVTGASSRFGKAVATRLTQQGFLVFGTSRAPVQGGSSPPELLADVLAGRFDPSPVLDMTVTLADVAEGYAAMDQRQAIKVMVRP